MLLKLSICRLLSEPKAITRALSRFINVSGAAGNNIPTDLLMEHLNKTLKDYLAKWSWGKYIRASHFSDGKIAQEHFGNYHKL